MAESRESARGPMFADGRFLHADARARFVPLTPRLPEHSADEGISAGAQHRARARSLAHHDAHRQVRAPLGARRRALCRDQHRRRAALRGARWRAGDAAIELGLDGGARAHGRRCSRRAWCSRPSTGTARLPPMRASARSPTRWSIRSPASPSSSTRRWPIEHFAADWYGVMLARAAAAAARHRLVDEGAGRAVRALRARGPNPADWSIEARRLLGVPSSEAAARRRLDRIPRSGGRVYRARLVRRRAARRLHLCRPSSGAARARLAGETVRGGEARRARCAPACSPGARVEGADQGALVCSCFGVGRNPIAACARELGAAATPAEIGKRLKCGTNCGSCIPEIQAIIGEVAKKSA